MPVVQEEVSRVKRQVRENEMKERERRSGIGETTGHTPMHA